jgi:hypothetical protein
MKWKGCERKGLWPYFKELPLHLPGEIEENHVKHIRIVGGRDEI